MRVEHVPIMIWPSTQGEEAAIVQSVYTPYSARLSVHYSTSLFFLETRRRFYQSNNMQQIKQCGLGYSQPILVYLGWAITKKGFTPLRITKQPSLIQPTIGAGTEAAQSSPKETKDKKQKNKCRHRQINKNEKAS